MKKLSVFVFVVFAACGGEPDSLTTATAKEALSPIPALNYSIASAPDNYWSFVETGHAPFHFPGLEDIYHGVDVFGTFYYDFSQPAGSTGTLAIFTRGDTVGAPGPNCLLQLSPLFDNTSLTATSFPELASGAQTYFGTREGLVNLAQRGQQFVFDSITGARRTAIPIFRYDSRSSGTCKWGNDFSWVPKAVWFVTSGNYDSHSYVYIQGPKVGNNTTYFYAEMQ